MHLHSSFNNPTRSASRRGSAHLPRAAPPLSSAAHLAPHTPAAALDKPPYEIKEFGWGEFDIAIKVYFKPQHLKPVGFQSLAGRPCLLIRSRAQRRCPPLPPDYVETFPEALSKRANGHDARQRCHHGDV